MEAEGTGKPRRILAVVLLTVCTGALADPVEVIFTEIAGDPTAVVTGARDANGQPVFAEFTALEELALRHDGGQWVVKGRTNLGSSLDAILMLGSGLTGTTFAQDGQPVQGGVAGELYDFFDSPVPAAWDKWGNLAFSCRVRGGSSAIFEKVIVYNGVTHTVVIQMGDPALGLIDQPPNPSGTPSTRSTCWTTDG